MYFKCTDIFAEINNYFLYFSLYTTLDLENLWLGDDRLIVMLICSAGLVLMKAGCTLVLA